MKILLIGASGTIGKRIYDAFSKKHDVVRASRSGADVSELVSEVVEMGK
jgi:uncharacterized protein YbjT (DUF2867 family)